MRSMSKHSDRLIVAALAALFGLLGLSLTGCNTTEGVGQDIEAAGEGIQDAAD